MTRRSHSESSRADLALEALDWLDSREESSSAIDEVLHILADHRRRLLLEVMTAYDEELTLPDAAEEVARREANRAITELSAERIAEVYISLYHDHLPRLTDAGLLEYDQERDLVAPAAVRSGT